MPTSITNLKVFVASPSDVKDERSILEIVINELNKVPGNRLNVRFELLKWETDSYPSIGEDAQSVINSQIGDSYDIFVGILSKRFGTPTNKAESGTEEEFRLAYERHSKDAKDIRIMFYFNDSPISPSELDIEQYIKVKIFRESLGQQGVYYWTYKKTDDFEKLTRLHLGRVMEEFSDGKWGIVPQVNSTSSEPIEDSLVSLQNEEEGFLDYIIISIEDMNSATESMNRIASLMKELNNETVENTGAIRKLPQPINANSAKPLVNKQATLWKNFSQRVEAELPILSSKFRSGIDAYTKSAQLLHDFNTKDKQQVEKGLDTIKNYKPIAIESQKNTIGFRDVVQNMPRLTKELNQAKRQLIVVLDKIIEEYKSQENLATEAEKIFLDVLKKFEE